MKLAGVVPVLVSAAAAAGHQDFLADAVGAFDNQHATAALPA